MVKKLVTIPCQPFEKECKTSNQIRDPISFSNFMLEFRLFFAMELAGVASARASASVSVSVSVAEQHCKEHDSTAQRSSHTN